MKLNHRILCLFENQQARKICLCYSSYLLTPILAVGLNPSWVALIELQPVPWRKEENLSKRSCEEWENEMEEGFGVGDKKIILIGSGSYLVMYWENLQKYIECRMTMAEFTK